MNLAPFVFAMFAATLSGIGVGMAAGAAWGIAEFALLVFFLNIVDGVLK